MNCKILKICINAIICVCFFSFVSEKNDTVYAEEEKNKNKVYLSQVYVDTMVQNAYYNFLAAGELSGGEFRQTQAIAHAKTVSNRLKALSKGDPNRKYIMWRVGELEQQIYLEEEELELKRRYRTQKAINELVKEFNPEIGKSRPSFSNLFAIHERTLNLSWQKADELKWLINDRNKNISREVLYFCEKALTAGNYDKAYKEFEYMRSNRKYLNIPENKYRNIEFKMQAKYEADDMVKNLDKYSREIQTIIAGTDIQEAKYSIDFLQYRLKQVRKMISDSNYETFTNKINELSDKVTQKEDSLVNINIQLVHSGKSDAAIDFLDNVLRKHCVSNKKLVLVDKAIMSMPRQQESLVDNNIDLELNTFEKTSSSSGSFDFNDVEQKAAEKADSIRAFNADPDRSDNTNFKKGSNTPTSQNRNYAALSPNQKKAEDYIMRINNLLDQNKFEEAYLKFQKHKNPLKKYAPQEKFSKLEHAVDAGYKSSKKKITLLNS